MSHVGVDTAELQLGDNLKINLNLQRQTNEDRDITYLVRAVACVYIITVFLYRFPQNLILNILEMLNTVVKRLRFH